MGRRSDARSVAADSQHNSCRRSTTRPNAGSRTREEVAEVAGHSPPLQPRGGSAYHWLGPPPRAGLAPGVVLLALFHSSHFTLGFLRVSLLADQASHWWQQCSLGRAPEPDGVPISVTLAEWESDLPALLHALRPRAQRRS